MPGSVVSTDFAKRSAFTFRSLETKMKAETFRSEHVNHNTYIKDIFCRSNMSVRTEKKQTSKILREINNTTNDRGNDCFNIY